MRVIMRAGASCEAREDDAAVARLCQTQLSHQGSSCGCRISMRESESALPPAAEHSRRTARRHGPGRCGCRAMTSRVHTRRALVRDSALLTDAHIGFARSSDRNVTHACPLAPPSIAEVLSLPVAAPLNDQNLAFESTGLTLVVVCSHPSLTSFASTRGCY